MPDLKGKPGNSKKELSVKIADSRVKKGVIRIPVLQGADPKLNTHHDGSDTTAKIGERTGRQGCSD